MLENRVHDIASHVNGDREPDALIAPTSASEYRGIDANQFAPRIDQRSAGISRVNRSIGLNEILVVLDVEVAAARGTDYS